MLINSLPLNNVHTTSRHICDCTQVFRVSRVRKQRQQRASFGLGRQLTCASGATLRVRCSCTAGQTEHTPQSTQPVGEHWPWYVCVPCTSVSRTTRSDTTACHCMHGEHGQASLLPWISPVVGCVGVCVPCCLSPLESATISLMTGLSPTYCMHINLRSIAPAHSSTVLTASIVVLINSLPLNNVHTTSRHICDPTQVFRVSRVRQHDSRQQRASFGLGRQLTCSSGATRRVRCSCTAGQTDRRSAQSPLHAARR